MPQGSRPQYRVLVGKDVPMHTRDGVTLRADVYRPDTAGRFRMVKMLRELSAAMLT